MGLPVTALDGKEIGGAGTAAMAGYAAGIYEKNIILAKPRKTFYPNNAKHEYYKKQLAKYKKIYNAAKEVMRDE